MTRIAAFGGPYANPYALRAMLADARARGCKRIFCLGDLGGFGAECDAIWPLLEGVECIAGNYDVAIGRGEEDCGCGYSDERDNHYAQLIYDYTREATSPAFAAWMRALPVERRESIGGVDVHLVHASPLEINDFLWESLDDDDLRLRFVVMNFWSLGGIAAGLVSILFVSALLGQHGWRYALLFGAISAAYALYARRLVPESPRWLASQGRLEEASAVIEQVTGVERERAEYLPAELNTGVRAQLAELWRHHRGRLVFGMALDFSEAAAYYGLFTFLSVFVLTAGVVDVPAGTVPYYYVIANVGALAGGLLVSHALDRAGRKPTVFLAYAAAAASTFLVAAAAATGSPGLTLAAFTTAVFFATTAWVGAYPTFTELFPTHLRATGVGASVAVGRIGAIIGAVVLAQTASSFGMWSAFATLAGLWSIGALAAAIWWLRGVEARGMTLEALARA